MAHNARTLQKHFGLLFNYAAYIPHSYYTSPMQVLETLLLESDAATENSRLQHVRIVALAMHEAGLRHYSLRLNPIRRSLGRPI
jgi:hypothetical protein